MQDDWEWEFRKFQAAIDAHMRMVEEAISRHEQAIQRAVRAHHGHIERALRAHQGHIELAREQFGRKFRNWGPGFQPRPGTRRRRDPDVEPGGVPVKPNNPKGLSGGAAASIDASD